MYIYNQRDQREEKCGRNREASESRAALPGRQRKEPGLLKIQYLQGGQKYTLGVCRQKRERERI